MSREIDDKIALKVFGWERSSGSTIPPCWEKDGRPIIPIEDWCPTVDIDQAWHVVEELRSQRKVSYGYWPFIFHEDRYGGCYSRGRWLASFGLDAEEYEAPLGGDNEARDYWEGAPKISASSNPAMAICLAALAAIGNHENNKRRRLLRHR